MTKRKQGVLITTGLIAALCCGTVYWHINTIRDKVDFSVRNSPECSALKVMDVYETGDTSKMTNLYVKRRLNMAKVTHDWDDFTVWEAGKALQWSFEDNCLL